VTRELVRPVKVKPRLDAKPWGGRLLEAWGIRLPPGETIGEALLTAPEATVISGALSGTPLSALASRDPAAWIGARGLAATGGRPIFPLLVKLIDGQADLSIQIHPDDRAAAAAGLGTGKTEAYHILAAEPGSVIYLGLDPEVTPEEFATACLRANGSAARCLRRIPAAPGTTVLIPAGTPHALGAGVLLYEIQQPSNVTFRLDDWGRVDASGMARAAPRRGVRVRQSTFALGADLHPVGQPGGGPGAAGDHPALPTWRTLCSPKQTRDNHRTLNTS
jgi:mannose-6-phosphate isomerase